MQGIMISVSADSDTDEVNMEFQAICNSTEDANLLNVAIQAGLLYQRYQLQESQANSDLASVLGQARVGPSGDRLRLNFSMSQAQLVSILLSHAFTPRT
jgi:hypothetical protein